MPIDFHDIRKPTFTPKQNPLLHCLLPKKCKTENQRCPIANGFSLLLLNPHDLQHVPLKLVVVGDRVLSLGHQGLRRLNWDCRHGAVRVGILVSCDAVCCCHSCRSLSCCVWCCRQAESVGLQKPAPGPEECSGSVEFIIRLLQVDGMTSLCACNILFSSSHRFGSLRWWSAVVTRFSFDRKSNAIQVEGLPGCF